MANRKDTKDTKKGTKKRGDHATTPRVYVDGPVKWHAPSKPIFLLPTKGLDYDGDGILGDENVIR